MSMLSWVRSINELSEFLGDGSQEVHLTTDKHSVYFTRTIKLDEKDIGGCFFELREGASGLELRVNVFDGDGHNLLFTQSGAVDDVCDKLKEFACELRSK